MPVRGRIVERQSEMGFVECGGLWLGYTVALWPIRGGSRRLKRQDEMVINKDFGRAGRRIVGYRFRATGG